MLLFGKSPKVRVKQSELSWVPRCVSRSPVWLVFFSFSYCLVRQTFPFLFLSTSSLIQLLEVTNIYTLFFASFKGL